MLFIFLVALLINTYPQVKKSEVQKFLSAYQSESEPRESDGKIVRFDLVYVRTPGSSAEEVMVRLALLPLRINVDQVIPCPLYKIATVLTVFPCYFMRSSP